MASDMRCMRNELRSRVWFASHEAAVVSSASEIGGNFEQRLKFALMAAGEEVERNIWI